MLYSGANERNIEYPKLEQIIDDHGKKTGVFICSCENLKAKQQDGNPYIRLSEEKDTVLVARVYRHLERHHMKAVDRAKKRPNDGKQDKFMFWSSLTIKESFFLPVGYWKFIEKWFRLFYFSKNNLLSKFSLFAYVLRCSFSLPIISAQNWFRNWFKLGLFQS